MDLIYEVLVKCRCLVIICFLPAHVQGNLEPSETWLINKLGLIPELTKLMSVCK
jgi:hypothetical protein